MVHWLAPGAPLQLGRPWRGKEGGDAAPEEPFACHRVSKAALRIQVAPGGGGASCHVLNVHGAFYQSGASHVDVGCSAKKGVDHCNQEGARLFT